MSVSSVVSTTVTADSINTKEGMEKDFKFLQSQLKSCQELESEQKSSSLHHDEVITKIAQMLKESNYTDVTYELESIQKRLTVIQSLRQQHSDKNLALDYFGLANRIRYISYQYFPNTMPENYIWYQAELDTIIQEVDLNKLEQLFFSNSSLSAHPSSLKNHILDVIKRATNHCPSANLQSQAIQLLEHFLRAGLGLSTALKYAFLTNHPTNKEKIVRMLLEYGADPNESFWDITNSSNPPLAHSIAFSKNRTSIRKIAQELLNHGMDVHVGMDPSTKSSPNAIHSAIGVKRWDLITIYIYNSITIPTSAEKDAEGSPLIGKAKAIYTRALGALSKSQVTYFQSQSILEALPTVLLHLVAEYFLDKKTIPEQCYLIEEEDKKANAITSSLIS